MFLRLFFVLAFAVVPGFCVAAGTVSFSAIAPLLAQKPQIREFLRSSLDMDQTVTAAVRFGRHFKYLGGARMGPYIIRARPKTPQNAAPIEVVLCTDAKFFDGSGKPTRDKANAARFAETLTVVMLRDADASPAIPSCP